MDEALGLPTERRGAPRAAHAAGDRATRPASRTPSTRSRGSYFVESLTDAIEAEAAEYIAKIDAMGGAMRAIERGFQQREIHEAAYRWQKRVESGDAVVVGVNRFTCGRRGEAARPQGGRDRPRRERRERLAALRGRRDADAVDAALAAGGRGGAHGAPT